MMSGRAAVGPGEGDERTAEVVAAAMLRVGDEKKWGWQEGTATEWLEKAPATHPAAYDAALARLQRS